MNTAKSGLSPASSAIRSASLDYSVVGKSSPSANGVLAVLPANGVHLEIQLSQKRQLLVEKVILPGPWSAYSGEFGHLVRSNSAT